MRHKCHVDKLQTAEYVFGYCLTTGKSDRKIFCNQLAFNLITFLINCFYTVGYQIQTLKTSVWHCRNESDTGGQISDSLSGVKYKKKNQHIDFKACTNCWMKDFRTGLRKLKMCLKSDCSVQQNFQFLDQWVLVVCGSLFCSLLYDTTSRVLLIFFFFPPLFFFIYSHFLYLFNFPHTLPIVELPCSKICEWQQIWQSLGWWRIWQEQASSAGSSG